MPGRIGRVANEVGLTSLATYVFGQGSSELTCSVVNTSDRSCPR